MIRTKLRINLLPTKCKLSWWRSVSKDPIPLFSVNLILEEGSTEPQFSVYPGDAVSNIMQIFDLGIEKLQEITHEEQKLIPHFLKEQQQQHVSESNNETTYRTYTTWSKWQKQNGGWEFVGLGSLQSNEKWTYEINIPNEWFHIIKAIDQHEVNNISFLLFHLTNNNLCEYEH